jgi:hypothetical protein
VSGIRERITSLDTIITSLPAVEREVFDRIYRVTVSSGLLKPPASMNTWIEEQFSSLERALKQKIIRVTNLVTGEEALFNRLRAERPMRTGRVGEYPFPHENDSSMNPFHAPLSMTPEDVFGRIEGKHCVTASNVAKYDAFHGVIIFNEHNPLQFSREQVIDYIDTGCRWAQAAHSYDPEAKYFFFMWNCGGRAGASLPHGHAQVTLCRSNHYAKIEWLRRAALVYRERYGTSYFDDLYRSHHSVGVGFEKDMVKVMAYLSPIKEKEVVLISRELDTSFKERFYEVLACLRDRMGVTSFNAAFLLPPIAQVEESWEGFPAIARIVDRGGIESRASDIGTMELYAANVISSDPFEVAMALRAGMQNLK